MVFISGKNGSYYYFTTVYDAWTEHQLNINVSKELLRSFQGDRPKHRQDF